jgi:hypothetical protein
MPATTDQRIADDVLRLLSERAGTYTNRDTGAVASGLPLSDIQDGLRELGWRNIRGWNSVDADQLQTAGFRVLRAHGNPNRGERGDWANSKGRSVAKWTTIIAL